MQKQDATERLLLRFYHTDRITVLCCHAPHRLVKGMSVSGKAQQVQQVHMWHPTGMQSARLVCKTDVWPAS